MGAAAKYCRGRRLVLSFMAAVSQALALDAPSSWPVIMTIGKCIRSGAAWKTRQRRRHGGRLCSPAERARQAPGTVGAASELSADLSVTVDGAEIGEAK